MMKYILFFMLSLLLTNCQSQLKGKSGRSLYLNFQEGDPPSLHPQFSISHARCRCLSLLLFECLTRINTAGVAELAGARSVEISANARKYTFTLREHLWSDGSLVTAFQYEAAWKKVISFSSSCPFADLFYPIKNAKEIKKGECDLSELGVKALDEKTLEIELTHPMPVFLELLALSIFAPLKNAEEKEPSHFNGSFFVDRWEKGKCLHLKKNPFFWNKGNVKLEEIDIAFLLDPQTNLYLYEKKEIDWIGAPISTLPMEAISLLEESQILLKRNSSLVLWLHVNTECLPFTSPAWRRALSNVIDRKEINKHILIGNPLYTPLPPSLSLISDIKHAELAPQATQSRISTARQEFETALKESGTNRETFVLQLRHFNHPRMKLLAEYLQQQWQNAFGITVNLICSDWNTFRSALEKRDFQIGACNECSFYSDPLSILERFENQGTINYSQWEDTYFQECIASARACQSQVDRDQWVRKAEAILAEQLPVIPISNCIQCYSHHPSLKGYVFDYGGTVDFSYAYFEELFF